MKTTEPIIRERANHLWELAGRPEERSEEFWLSAKSEFERKGWTGERRFVVPVRRSADVRCETAADWRKRRRDPSF